MTYIHLLSSFVRSYSNIEQNCIRRRRGKFLNMFHYTFERFQHLT
jgi:hypothetical protein